MKKISHLISLLLMNLLVITCFAQTGPGGVGNSADNVVWLDADVVTFGTSPNILTWPDQSGNGNDFTQGAASLQPRRINYSTHKSVRFVDDYLQRGAISTLNTNTISQFFVFEGSVTNHRGVILDASYTQSNQFLRTYRDNGNIRSWALNSVGGIEDNITPIASPFQIVSSLWDGAGTQTFDSYVNGTSIGSNAGANGSPTGNHTNTVGAQRNGGLKFDGDMGEIIMYDVLLNSAQRKIVDNYLSAKYTIGIASDMFAYDPTHRYQVVGIGQEPDGNNLAAQGKSIVEISISSLANGEYVFIGHNNTDFSFTSTDVPAIIAGGTRETRTWRSDLTGTPGVVDIVFNVSTLPLPAGSYWIIVDSDGVFNAGATSYGPFIDAGGLVTATGVTLSDGDYFTIASGATVAISTVKTGDWDDATTWTCNCVPILTDNVTINAGHTVTVDATTAVNDLTINGVINSISISLFDVHGDYTVGATGSVIHKRLTFKGSVNQSLTNASVTPVNFRVMIIENSNNVELNGGPFEITNYIQINAGQLINNSSTFTFVSNASATAVILNSPGNGFAGNYIVQRYISTRNASWGDFSSPVSNTTLGQWDSDESGSVTEMIMSNVGGVDGNAGNFYSVWDWNEGAQKYDSIIDTSYVIPVGMGIEIWMEDVASTWNAKTIDSRGTPNFGNVAKGVVNAWNLVGNPYQNWIRWTNLTKPTLNPTYYIWNTSTASYDAKTNGAIPPHQAFWVESVGAGTLTFTESSKTNSGSSTFWRMNQLEDDEPFEFVEAKLKIKSNDHTYAHTLKLRMNNLAEVGSDYFDASFKSSRIEEAPSITSYSANSNKELAINSFNYQEEVMIPVDVKVGVSGEYIIEAISFEAFEAEYDYIELKDNKTGKVYNLESDNEIVFDINKEDNANRFTLRLSNLLSQSSDALNGNVNIYKTNEHTIIEFDNTDVNYEVSIYNSIGQKVIENISSGNKKSIVIANSKLPHGINIITVRSAQNNVVKKLQY